MRFRVIEKEDELWVIDECGGVVTVSETEDGARTEYYKNKIDWTKMTPDNIWDKLAEGDIQYNGWEGKSFKDPELIKDALYWLCLECDWFEDDNLWLEYFPKETKMDEMDKIIKLLNDNGFSITKEELGEVKSFEDVESKLEALDYIGTVVHSTEDAMKIINEYHNYTGDDPIEEANLLLTDEGTYTVDNINMARVLSMKMDRLKLDQLEDAIWAIFDGDEEDNSNNECNHIIGLSWVPDEGHVEFTKNNAQVFFEEFDEYYDIKYDFCPRCGAKLK